MLKKRYDWLRRSVVELYQLGYTRFNNDIEFSFCIDIVSLTQVTE